MALHIALDSCIQFLQPIVRQSVDLLALQPRTNATTLCVPSITTENKTLVVSDVKLPTELVQIWANLTQQLEMLPKHELDDRFDDIREVEMDDWDVLTLYDPNVAYILTTYVQ